MIHNKFRYILTLVALFAMTAGAWADETPIVTITATDSGPAYSVDGIVTLETGGAGYGAGYGWLSGSPNYLTVTAADGVTITKVKFNGNKGSSWEDTESPFQVLLQNYYVKNASGTNIGSDDGVTKIEVYGTIAPAGPEVTTNAASEGATFTEASFEMPTNDVTIDYEIVRDMAISMTTKVGDGNDGYRIRLKKSEQNPGKFEPADTDVAGMIAMIKVHDAIENQDLIFFNLGGSVDCTVSIYALDDNDQPVGDPVAFQDLVPGRYIAKATAATGSTYDGETANSNVFVLFLGYPVEVPAGEFATFYKDEPLYADPISSADAELYTISSVNDTQAVLSSAIETAPSKTPLLVYNNSDEAKTFLLIPADAEPNLSLDVYDGFIGTLTATTIAASDEDQTNYALNGKAFVYVKYAIPVAANKAWLNISNSNARVINIVFDETTGITNADRTKSTDDSWYTIDGRKVNAPTKKGVYILNGQKVVVK